MKDVLGVFATQTSGDTLNIAGRRTRLVKQAENPKNGGNCGRSLSRRRTEREAVGDLDWGNRATMGAAKEERGLSASSRR